MPVGTWTLGVEMSSSGRGRLRTLRHPRCRDTTTKIVGRPPTLLVTFGGLQAGSTLYDRRVSGRTSSAMRHNNPQASSSRPDGNQRATQKRGKQRVSEYPEVTAR